MIQKLILCYAYTIINVPLKSKFHPGDSCMYPTLLIPPCNMVTTGKSRILAAFIIYTWVRVPKVRDSQRLEFSSCSHLFSDTRANRTGGTTVVTIDQLTTSEKYMKKGVEIY